MGFWGYRTKLFVIVGVAFVIGYTIVRALSSLLGGLGGFLGSLIYKADVPVAPWRDPAWRALVKSKLGARAPNDTTLEPEQIYNFKCELVKRLPENERGAKLAALAVERSNAEQDDWLWRNWYDHYHQIVLGPKAGDFLWHVQTGINFNLQATALYVLISMCFVPSIRHWWSVVPAITWLALFLLELYSTWIRYSNRWTTLMDQIKYLSQDGPASQPASEPTSS